MINLVTSFIRIARFAYPYNLFENMENQHAIDNVASNGAPAYHYYMQQECIYNQPFGQPSVMYPSYNQPINEASGQVHQQYGYTEFHNHLQQHQHIPLATTHSYNDMIVQHMPPTINHHHLQQQWY